MTSVRPYFKCFIFSLCIKMQRYQQQKEQKLVKTGVIIFVEIQWNTHEILLLTKWISSSAFQLPSKSFLWAKSAVSVRDVTIWWFLSEVHCIWPCVTYDVIICDCTWENQAQWSLSRKRAFNRTKNSRNKIRKPRTALFQTFFFFSFDNFHF